MPRKTKKSKRREREAPRLKRKVRNSKHKVRVDFAGVESGGARLPAGDYHAKVEEVTREKGDKSREYYLAWEFKTIDDQKKLDGKTLYFNTSLQPQSLWNLRNLLEALDVEVPDGEMDIDLKALAGSEIMLYVEETVYEGKKQSKVTDFYTFEDDEDEDDEDEDDEDEDDEEEAELDDEDEEELEEISSDEVNDMSAEELEDLVEKYDLDVSFKGKRSLRKKKNAVLDALEEADLLAEDDD